MGKAPFSTSISGSSSSPYQNPLSFFYYRALKIIWGVIKTIPLHRFNRQPNRKQLPWTMKRSNNIWDIHIFIKEMHLAIEKSCACQHNWVLVASSLHSLYTIKDQKASCDTNFFASQASNRNRKGSMTTLHCSDVS